MDRSTAKHLKVVMLNVSTQLNESIFCVRDSESEEDFKQYRRTIGSLLGRIYDYVLQPIFDEYPDLMPEELRPPKP